MEDTFIIFFDLKVLVTLRGFRGSPLPSRETVLDGYGANYAFERARLTGGYVHSVSVEHMAYEDFFNERPTQRGYWSPEPASAAREGEAR